MTPHDPTPRTLRPGQQGPSSATLVDEVPSSPDASTDGFAEWRDDPQPRERIVEVIAMLESAATAMGATALTPDDLRAARHTNRLLAEAAARGLTGRAVELVDAFHRCLYARCGNSRMVELLDEEMTLLRAVDPEPVGLSPSRLRRIVAAHDEIVDLIEADPAAATIPDALRAHRGHDCYL